MWEVWEPEERPFLMVVRPEISESDGSIRANTTFLVPSFEDVRARLLNMPFAEPEIQTIRYVRAAGHHNIIVPASYIAILTK